MNESASMNFGNMGKRYRHKLIQVLDQDTSNALERFDLFVR